MYSTVQPKESILRKKEIGEYGEIKCHLFCDLNFYEFWEKPVLPPLSPPPPNSLLIHTHIALYTPNSWLISQEPWKFKKQIRWHFSSSYSSISYFNHIFSFLCTYIPIHAHLHVLYMYILQVHLFLFMPLILSLSLSTVHRSLVHVLAVSKKVMT